MSKKELEKTMDYLIKIYEELFVKEEKSIEMSWRTEKRKVLYIEV